MKDGSSDFESPPQKSLGEWRLPAGTVGLLIGWFLLVALGGGVLSGWSIYYFGSVGNLTLVIVGVLAGVVARKIAGWGELWIVVALVLAMLVCWYLAEAFWLYWGGFQGAETWWGAMRMVLTLPKDGRTAFFIGAFCTAVGVYSAYWQLMRR